MPTRPPRFRFGLRTLFVLVTVASVATAWVTYSLNWIRQRREWHPEYVVERAGDPFPGNLPANVQAPWGLWLFGETGVVQVRIMAGGDDDEFERVCRLFPEAIVSTPRRQPRYP